MVLFHGMVWDGWLVSYTALLALEGRLCVPAVKESTFFVCSLILRPNFLPVSPTYELEQFLQGTRSIRSSLHPWPCPTPSDEPQSSIAFGEDGSCGDAVRFQNSCKYLAQSFHIWHDNHTCVYVFFAFFASSFKDFSTMSCLTLSMVQGG